MLKYLSIPVLIVILFSGITVNFATHYCGGSVAAKNVSFSGSLASCGMEDHKNNSSETIFRSHCCENITSSYAFNNNYFPSLQQILKPAVGHTQFNLVAVVELNTCPSFPADYNNTGPPGYNSPESVTLEEICILRI